MQPNNTTRLQVPIIMGDSYLDPITCQESRVSSFRLMDSNTSDSSGPTVVPFCGGYQAYLDADVMATEKRMLEALRDFKDTLNGNFYAGIMVLYLFLLFCDLYFRESVFQGVICVIG